MSERIPNNTPVILTDDHGHRWQTRTRSERWALGDGTLIQKVDGIAGGYLASRLEAGVDPDLPHFTDRREIDRGSPPKTATSPRQQRAKDRYRLFLRVADMYSFKDFLRFRMYDNA